MAVLLTGLCCATVQRGYFRLDGELDEADYLDIWEDVLDWPPTGGNRITILENGDTAFPAMLNAIASAQDHVHFETYLFYSNATGKKFMDALCEKAREGVEVRLLVDFFGGRISKEHRQYMTDCGIMWKIFNPINPLHPLKSNIRTHRKILVIDGKLAYTGGMGISDEWTGDADSPDHWHDLQVEIEGPIVEQLQKLFAVNWERTTGEAIEGERYFPPQREAGDKLCGVVGKWLPEGKNYIREMWLLPLAAAKEYYYMAIGYFLPDPDTIKAFEEAVKRGVDVRIILPGEWTDLDSIRYAAMRHYGNLLKAGVKLYEYQDTNIHAKFAVVDDRWSTIGSANFTNRAFTYVYENNLVCFDEGLALDFKAIFERDLARSKEITLADWENRPIPQRFLEEIYGLLDGWM